jgi:hypothetical protein
MNGRILELMMINWKFQLNLFRKLFDTLMGNEVISMRFSMCESKDIEYTGGLFFFLKRLGIYSIH